MEKRLCTQDRQVCDTDHFKRNGLFSRLGFEKKRYCDTVNILYFVIAKSIGPLRNTMLFDCTTVSFFFLAGVY